MDIVKQKEKGIFQHKCKYLTKKNHLFEVVFFYDFFCMLKITKKNKTIFAKINPQNHRK